MLPNYNLIFNYHNYYQGANPQYKISDLENDIIYSVSNKKITFISSPTGSGKSTQIPQYIANHNFKVLCSQPRKISCVSISEYIKYQNQNLNIQSGSEFFYYDNNFDLLFLRESTLLNLLCRDPLLSNVDVLIIDEVHERTMVLDLILFFIKYFTLQRNNFKLVIMSATLDTDNIRAYFADFINNDNMGEIIQNFNMNYDIIYRPLRNDDYLDDTRFNTTDIKFLIQSITNTIRDIIYNDTSTEVKTILVFLPDFKSIYFTDRALSREFGLNVTIVQFFGSLNYDEQLERISDSGQSRYKVVLSTTLAETCLTISNCCVVIDTGIRKYNKYNYDTNLYEEYIDYISQDSATQRAGRCGREKKRGVCYRLYSMRIFNAMKKHRVAEVEMMNIDNIILRLFDANFNKRELIESVSQRGFLDFVSKIDYRIFDIVMSKLCVYGCLRQNEGNVRITDFGEWLCKTQLDVLIGKMLYDMEKNNELNHEIVQTLALITQNQSCELFYANVDSKWFKLNFVDYFDTNFDLRKYTKEITNKIISNVIDNYEFDASWINLYQPVEKEYLYFKLFSILDEVYNVKYFYSRNKIFTLGDLMIGLFYMREYKNMMCIYHYDKYFESKQKYKKKLNGKCHGCSVSKFYYCSVYSLNEKFFTTQKNKEFYMFKYLHPNIKKNKKLKCRNEEIIFAYWNKVYLTLISNKPFEYLKVDYVRYLLKQISYVNFDALLEKLYQQYKTFYIDFGKKVLRSIEDKVFYKKTFNANETNAVDLYYNVYHGDYDRVKIVHNYFFNFYKKSSNMFFSLVRYSKVSNIDIINYKNINPIFPEMLTQSIQNKLRENDERINDINVHIERNIGKFFYNTFLKNKFKSNTVEFSKNSLFFIFFGKDNSNSEVTAIRKCIDIERHNFSKMVDNFQILKNGCLNLQLIQGFTVVDIKTTKEAIVYEIKSYFEDIKINTDDIKDICYDNNIKYKYIDDSRNNVRIAFNNNAQSFEFIKTINKYFDLTISPVLNCKEKSDIQNTNKIFYLEYQYNTRIHPEIKKVLQQYDVKYSIVDTANRTVLYYILGSDVIENYYIYEEIQNTVRGREIDKNEIFQIKKKTLLSDPNYLYDFNIFLHRNNISISELKFRKNQILYKIDNFSINKKNLIMNYLSETEIQLSTFAIYELKIKSKDTFLYNSNTSLFDYARMFKCNIDIVHIDNRLVIYGAPNHREKFESIITNYLDVLNKEKKTMILTNQQSLLLRSLLKNSSAKRFLIFPTRTALTTSIEYREQYKDIIVSSLKISSQDNKAISNDNDIDITKCEICLENVNSYNEGNNIIQLRFCGHYFCIECLKMQIASQLNSGQQIKCIKCNMVIANNDIKEVLSMKELQKASYILVRNFVDSEQRNKRGRFKWCPNPRCDYIYERERENDENYERVCPNCDKVYCLRCEEEIVDRNQHARTCIRKLLKKVDFLDRKWIENNTRCCPLCAKPYEKIAGCNHMTCKYCRPQTEFCFICGKVLDSDNPLRHYSDEKSKCFNRLYEEFKPGMNEEEIKEENESEVEEEEVKEEKDESKEEDLTEFIIENEDLFLNGKNEISSEEEEEGKDTKKKESDMSINSKKKMNKCLIENPEKENDSMSPRRKEASSNKKNKNKQNNIKEIRSVFKKKKNFINISKYNIKEEEKSNSFSNSSSSDDLGDFIIESTHETKPKKKSKRKIKKSKGKAISTSDDDDDSLSDFVI